VLLAKGWVAGWCLWRPHELDVWLLEHDLDSAVGGRRGKLSLVYEDDLPKTQSPTPNG